MTLLYRRSCLGREKENTFRQTVGHISALDAMRRQLLLLMLIFRTRRFCRFILRRRLFH